MPPETFLYRLIAQDQYFDDLVDLKLPNYLNLTLNELLDVWELLFALSIELMKEFPSSDDVSNIKKLSQYAPTIERNELVHLLAKGMNKSISVSNKIVEFLTFTPSPRCELWMHPLVPVDSNTLVPVLAPIMAGNLGRIIEYWLKTGGIDFGKKGHLFEKTVRESLAISIRKSKRIKRSFIFPRSLTFLGEEIDIVLGIGSKILIGEAKCKIFPTEPVDHHNYFKDINRGVKQIKRKIQKINENILEFSNVLNNEYEININEIKLIPFILTNLSIGVGFSISDIPIVDKLILKLFIEDGKWEMYVTYDHKGNRIIGKSVDLYDNEKEAIEMIDKYLYDPPQIRLYKSMLKTQLHPLPVIKDNDRKALIAYYQVEFPGLHNAFE